MILMRVLYGTRVTLLSFGTRELYSIHLVLSSSVLTQHRLLWSLKKNPQRISAGLLVSYVLLLFSRQQRRLRRRQGRLYRQILQNDDEDEDGGGDGGGGGAEGVGSDGTGGRGGSGNSEHRRR